MKKLLITGGSGFIGTNLINHLLQTNQTEVLNIDIAEPKIKEHRTYWEKVDIRDYNSLNKVVTKFAPDHLIHLAARTDLRGKTLKDYNTNSDGIISLLKILENTPTLKKAVFASSMYVCYPGYIPKNFDDYQPHTLYGESKVLTEQIIKTTNPNKYCWSIIRPTSIWGPWFGEPYNKFFKLILSHAYFHLGKKACHKTYGYVDNTVCQILSIINANNDEVHRKTYYLGDYLPYDITEWANEIAACASIRIPNIPYFLFVIAGRAGDFLQLFGIKFPMTSFRLKNMTTDNVHDLTPIKKLAPILPTSREEGNKMTIEWINRGKSR
ncbi:NAD(P)-dependent oxidoreductase [uncultured Alistipes sp.]|uniref:NAD-dependent epimerase/dehydratase family protein n=1 Tax=uncultured Alistipes sp. TaxID=538949 RepID=UPI0025E7523F|nr:NAD(P)-dependent oxidoreductase [uncultured Alistipes sp.]